MDSVEQVGRPENQGVGTQPLLASGDAGLLSDLHRLCAAAGLTGEVVADPGAKAAAWNTAPIVVVGGDAAASTGRSLGAGALTRRSGVIVVSTDRHDDDIWRRAVEVGAEHVIFLPDAESWLVDRIAASTDETRGHGMVLATVGGRGGAGATVLAAAIAVAAVRHALRALLVDADPLGGGIDLAVGAETVEGLRWRALLGATGRLPTAALEHALPSLGDLAVLSCDQHGLEDLPPAAMAALLDAGCRSSDLVVVDLPRRLDAAARVALSRATTALLVVPAEVRACAAAARVLRHLEPECADVRLVVRGPGPGRLAPAAVEDALGVPLIAYLRSEPSVVGALERGEPPGRRAGALARVARTLLRDLVLTTAAETR